MLIGREAESARLAAVLAAVREGAGGAVVLVGEPGIGKTTLLRSFVSGASDLLVLQTAGVESEADLPYSALADLLTPLVDRLDALPKAQATTLSSALALGPPVAVDRFAVAVATLALLGEAAEHRPALIVVDDLQWVDSASRDALAFVARRLSSIPVALLAAQREGAEALPGTDVVHVGPLGRAEATAVLTGATGGIAPQVVARLLDAARGNPLALVELPRQLTQAQLDGTEALGNPIATANGLERAFAAQLQPLSAVARRACVVAAADTSGTAGVVVAALAVLGLDAEALLEVERLGLLRVGANAVEFRHPIVRSAAYHGVDAAERRLVHGALASADDDPDRRVWHLAAAAVGPDETTAAELDRAGARAEAQAAAGAAAAAWERSAALTPDRQARGARLLKAASALEEMGDRVRSDALAVEALELLEDAALRGRAVALRASLKMSVGETEAGHAMLLNEAEGIAAVDPALAAGMLTLAVNLPLYRLEAAASVALTARAWAIGDPKRPRMFAERTGRAFALTTAGDAQAPALLLELAAEVTTSHVSHKQASSIAWPLAWVEEYRTARELLNWAIGVQRETGRLGYLPTCLQPLAELDFRVGRWVPALAAALEAISLFEETGQPTERGFACSTAARIEAALGRVEECRSHADEAFASDSASGLLIASAYSSAALGLLELGRGDAEAAIAALAPVERIVREGEVGEPWLVQWAPDLIEACSHVGRTDRAAEVLDAFELQARATGRVSALAAAARCRGILAPNDAFEELFGVALELHDRVPTPFERGRTELAYGERLRRAQKRSAARERLLTALQTFERLGAEPWAERARIELRASGQSVRTPEQQAENALTPQELQVAAIVAGGATNREAAAALFLSVKTIEFHLRHVYRKLGIRSRTELARAVDAPG